MVTITPIGRAPLPIYNCATAQIFAGLRNGFKPCCFPRQNGPATQVRYLSAVLVENRREPIANHKALLCPGTDIPHRGTTTMRPRLTALRSMRARR